MLELDLQSRQPIYEQLKSQISRMVLTGDLQPHDQLPSVRMFARDLGINPNTVQKAYQDLERDGIIYSAAGRGCFVSGAEKLGEKLMAMHLEGVTREARRAKSAGIPCQNAVQAVRIAYDGASAKEGDNHDTN